MPPETRKTRARPHRRHMASSAGAAYRASSCHVHSVSGAGNDTQVTEESLDEATNSGRVDVEGMTGKKERGCETTCAEFLGDNVDKAVDLIEAEDDVV